MGGLEHRVGLADPGRTAEKDPQLAAPGTSLLGVDGSQQLIGIGAHARFEHAAALSKKTKRVKI